MDGSTIAVLGWGTLVGLDLVTGPQVMIARPLVAGTVAGALLGDPLAGFRVGALLELLALEIMPFGSTRYADYGLGAVAAAAVAVGTPGAFGVGLGVGVGAAMALVGDTGTQLVRRFNSTDAVRRADGLDAGDPAVVRGVHFRSIGRDTLRAVVVTAVGLSVAAVVRESVSIPLGAAIGASVAAVGVAFGSAIVSATRYGRAAPHGVLLFVIGVLGGTIWVSLA